MPYSNNVMADVDLWCPALDTGATLVTVNQRLARHYQRRYDVWQQASGAQSWDTPNILSWRAWLLQLHDHALCEGLIEQHILNTAVDERLWRQAVSRVSEKEQQTLLDETSAARQARAAWLIQHAWHCHVNEAELLSLDQRAYGLWSKAFRQLCHQHNALDESRLAPTLRQLWEQQPTAFEFPECVLFAGFLTPTTEQQTWRQALTEKGVRVKTLQAQTQPVEPKRCACIGRGSRPSLLGTRWE